MIDIASSGYMEHVRLSFTAAAMLAMLAACVPGRPMGEGTETTTGGDVGETGAPCPDDLGTCPATVDDCPTYAEVQTIWTDFCTESCHEPFGSFENMDLRPGVSYPELLNEESLQNPGMARIEPNQLADSYLWLKINGTQNCVGEGESDTMPLDPTSAFSSAERTTISDWICCGAPEL